MPDLDNVILKRFLSNEKSRCFLIFSYCIIVSRLPRRIPPERDTSTRWQTSSPGSQAWSPASAVTSSTPGAAPADTTASSSPQTRATTPCPATGRMCRRFVVTECWPADMSLMFAPGLSVPDQSQSEIIDIGWQRKALRGSFHKEPAQGLQPEYSSRQWEIPS